MRLRCLLPFVVALVLVAGCGGGEARFNGSTIDEVGAEMDKFAKQMPPEKAAKLRTAVPTLGMMAEMQNAGLSPAERQKASLAVFRGKTPDEVIAEYEKLGSATQAAWAAGAAKAREQAGAKP